MTVVSDISNRLSNDAQFHGSAFMTAVFDYGVGIIGELTDWGYMPGQNLKIELEADRDDAEVYTEGQALPAPLESTYINASFAYKHFRAVIRESGHERRARGPADQGTRIADPTRKQKRAVAAIAYLIATTFDDAAIYGLEGQISAGTYNFGDQSRTTYERLKAYELNASSAAISTALLNKFNYLAMEDPYGAMFDFVVTSTTQGHKWAELGSGKLALNTANGALNLMPTDLMLGAAPVYILPNLTTSIVLGMTGVKDGSGRWGYAWNEANPGRYHVLDLGAANSDTPMNLQISTALAMAHENPNQQAKLYGLSTG